jgi:hypothetical protein
MRSVLVLVIRLYPRRWRQRYETEVLALIAASEPRGGDVVDLILCGVRAWIPDRPSLLLGGALSVLYRSSAHANRLALIGLLVLLPTLTLLVLSILKYILGIPGPFDVVEPTVTPFVTHPAGETAITLAPYVALLLALIPTVRVHARWHGSRLAGSIAFSAPAASIFVAAASTAVAVFMVLYWVAENV